MKNKIIMLLSLLLLCGMEAMAQLPRLAASQVTAGKRIMLRKVQKENRDFFNSGALSLPVGSYIFVVEDGEDGKILLKRESDNKYIGSDNTSIKFVDKANAQPFSVIKPTFDKSAENNDYNITDEKTTFYDGIEEDYIVRFVTTIGEASSYLNTQNKYYDGKGVWSVCEVYEVGTATTGGQLSGEGISPVYLMWKTDDGKVITAQSAVQGGSFFKADYTENNPMQQWQTVTVDGGIKIYNVGTGLYLSAVQESQKVLGFDDAAGLAGVYEQSQKGKNEIFGWTGSTAARRFLHSNAGDLVGWGTDAGASQWRLIEETQLPTVRENFALRNEFAPLLEEYENLFKRRYPFGANNGGVIRSVDQIDCNHVSTHDGSLEGLIDGIVDDPNHFHSDYDQTSDDAHYLEFTIKEEDRDNLYIIHYAARTVNSNDRPTEIQLYGINGETETLIKTLTTEDGLGLAEGFVFIDTDETIYEKLRFEVTATSSNKQFFTYGEFQIFKPSKTIKDNWTTLLEQWKTVHSIEPGVTLDYVEDNFAKELATLRENIATLRTLFSTVNVVYNCYYNNNKEPFTTSNLECPSRSVYPDFPQFDWVKVTTEKPAVAIEDSKTLEGVNYYEETNTYEIRVDYVFDDESNCPVKNSANGEYEWYLITLPSANTYNVRIGSSANGGNNNNTISSPGIAGRFDKTSWFAFEMADPSKTAFRIYAHAADGSVCELKTLNKGTGGSDNDGPTISENGNETLWTISANGNNWNIRIPGENLWWNQHGGANSGKLKYWTGSSPLNFVSEEAFLVEYIEPYKIVASLPEGEYLGLPTYEDSKTVAAEYDDNGLSESLYNDYIATTAVNAATVEAGKYYRIVNAAPRSVNSMYSGQRVMLGTEFVGNDLKAKGVACSKSDAGLVWRFEDYDAANENYAGALSICNPSAQEYLGAVAAGINTKTGLSATKQPYAFDHEGNGKFLIHNFGTGMGNKGAYLNMETNDSNTDYINGWNDNDNARWYLVEATTLDVELKENESRDYWTSIYLPFAVEVDVEDGVTIYGAKDNGTSLKLNQVDGQALAARQGALLNGSAAQVTLSILSGGAATAAQTLSENDLTGDTQDQPRGERTVYALSKQGEDDGILAFYKYTGDTLPAYKAYIVTDSGNAETLTAKYFDFGTVTGIDAAPTTSENTAADVYDLSGRRVSHAGKGLYIVGGRKVIR